MALDKKNENASLEAELEQGYSSATRQEGQELCREFEAADLENWDEY